MSDQRCPMCGKINPADVEVCQFCQARLKPVTKPEGDDKPETPESFDNTDSTKSADIPDWLDSLRIEDSYEAEQTDQGQVDGSFVEDDREDDLPTKDEWQDDDFRLPSYLLEENELERDLIHDGDIPSWLQDDRFSAIDENVSDGGLLSTDSEDQQQDDGIEWLKNIRSTDPDLNDEKDDTDLDGSLESIPDEDVSNSGRTDDAITWLNEFSETSILGDDSPELQKDEELGDIHQADSPGKEWVSEFEAGEDQPSTIDVEQVGQSREDESDVTSAEQIVEEEPGWIPGAEDDKPGEANDELDESATEFFQDGIPPFSVDVNDYISDEYPEWLDEIPADKMTESPSASEQLESDLEKADIPDWLQTMKSVETTLLEIPEVDETDRQIESAGPLAGIRGTLPAEPDVVLDKITITIPHKLQVTEKQKEQVTLIEDLINKEGEINQVGGRPTITSKHLLRLSIFIILLASVSIPLLGILPSTTLPLGSPALFDMNQVINTLTGNAPIIMAVDYEPAFTGEMEAAAINVIDHLMINGAYIVLVSTNSSGPIQAERLITLSNTNGDHDYQPTSQYVNLGYIPGGVTGLLGFVNTPRQVMQHDMNGFPAWEYAQLQSIASISDFALVLVLTDNADTARAWIEQLSYQEHVPPLVMVLSAQAEPLILPYYLSIPRQVEGIVAGVSGGASYERLMSRAGLASRYWDSFSVASIIGVSLVIFGGLFSIYITAFHQNKTYPKAGGE